ncbi:hypothetical protein U1Q18_005061, partial [Sarracenia purpurea var. burkii]
QSSARRPSHAHSRSHTVALTPSHAIASPAHHHHRHGTLTDLSPGATLVLLHHLSHAIASPPHHYCRRQESDFEN